MVSAQTGGGGPGEGPKGVGAGGVTAPKGGGPWEVGAKPKKKLEPEVSGPREVGAVLVEGGLGGCSFGCQNFMVFFPLPTLFQIFFIFQLFR